MKTWNENTIFYAIYPLGFCGAPPANDFSAPPEARLDQIHVWLEHIQNL
jgi:hypothetical protein